MNYTKRILLLLLLLLITITIVSCQEETYSLTLNDNISANIKSLTKIKKNKEITLTIRIPNNKEIDYLIINDEKIDLITSTYTFLIKENITASVYFKDSLNAFYNLLLPLEVTADIDDLNNIKKDTLITLTVLIPSKREFKLLRINQKGVYLLTNNQYSFKITENTIVSVYFDFFDEFKEVPLTESLAFGLKLKKHNIINSGLLTLNGNLNDFVFDFNFLLDEKLKIIEASGETLKNNKEVNYYYDNLNTYFKINALNDLTHQYIEGLFFPLNIKNIDDLIADTEEYLTDELKLMVFGDLVKIIFLNLTNQVLFNNIYFLKNALDYKLLAFLNKEDLLKIKGLNALTDIIVNLPDFYLELEVIFTDDKIVKALINIKGENEANFNLELYYTDGEIARIGDFSIYEKRVFINHIINIYLFDEFYLDVEVKDFLLNDLEEIDYEYLNKFNIKGLYRDLNYSEFLTIDDLKENRDLTIYILWNEVKKNNEDD